MLLDTSIKGTWRYTKMTAPFTRIVNNKHDSLVLTEQQDQAIHIVTNNRRMKVPAKKKHSAALDIVLALAFIAALAVAFYMVTADHRGDPSFGGTPISEMSISEQLKFAEEARYNDN